MFRGFNEATIEYFETIKAENSKKRHLESEQLYLEGVKYPLEDLYFELFNYFYSLDSELLNAKRRCVSTAYNDARFCREAPIKEYFYIRFKLNRADKKNTLGFFLDASLDGYRYGLNIYHMDARGMDRIRNYILSHKHFAGDVIQTFNESGMLAIQGEDYKKLNYPGEDKVLQEWLEHKRIALVHEEMLNDRFFSRCILDDLCAAFDSAKNVYFMLKEAL